MWIQSIAVGYLQYARIVYVFLTRIFIFYFFLEKNSIKIFFNKMLLSEFYQVSIRNTIFIYK
jgi:uncharacterized membrane protein AbrB (regulator of aidB expression)